MKSLTTIINEKLKISKVTDIFFYKILDIVDKYDLENIDNYNNELLAPGLYIDDDTVVDNIQFDNDNEEITIFYINDNDEEGDATFSHDEWYNYFDEEVTKSIYNHLVKNIKK